VDDILDQVTTPEQLGSLIDRRSADDLEAAVAAIPADQLLSRVFQAMQDRFRPERAGDSTGVAQFHITAADGTRHEWHLSIGAGTARASEGSAADPTATFGFTITDFLRLAAGRLTALEGVTAGRMDVSGNLRFAAELMGWFDLGSSHADPVAGALASIRTPAQLAALLNGRTDRDINDFALAVGAAPILEQAFKEMEGRFLPGKATGRSAIIQWTVTDPEGTRHEWHLTVGDGTCVATPGRAEKPNVTLGFTLPNFLRLAANTLSGVQGVMTGKIKVSGDLMLAAAMESWFARQ
jgi:putative sterol carrier protein